MARAHLVGAAMAVVLATAGCGDGGGGGYDDPPSETPSSTEDSAPRRIGGGDVPVTFEIPGGWRDFDSTSGDLERQLAEADLPEELQSRVEMAVAQLGNTPLLYAIDPQIRGDFATNVNAYCGTGEEDTSLSAIEKAAESGFTSMDADDIESTRVDIDGGEAVETAYTFDQDGTHLTGRQYGVPVDEQVCYVTVTTDDPDRYADAMTMLRDSLSIK